ncbi:hypothetical protein F4680DRAFT_443134 [Xylaria scruposa]|nr:hypothetical protein F4680DRAFT_443134 [Xylaria scruposa]
MAPPAVITADASFVETVTKHYMCVLLAAFCLFFFGLFLIAYAETNNIAARETERLFQLAKRQQTSRPSPPTSQAAHSPSGPLNPPEYTSGNGAVEHSSGISTWVETAKPTASFDYELLSACSDSPLLGE